jgi:hypothetical protein
LFSLLAYLNFAGDDGEIRIDAEEKENLVVEPRDIFTFMSIPDSRPYSLYQECNYVYRAIQSVINKNENYNLVRSELVLNAFR